jgi:hypothetical protein
MRRTRRSSLLFITLCSSAVLTPACGSEDSNSSNTDLYGPASAALTVTSQRPVANSSTGASFTVNVSFTVTPTRCTNTTIGACTVNPCFRPATATNSSTPVPSAGSVTLVPANGMPFAVEPQNDGVYPSESPAGQLPWTAGGQSVTFQWAHFPGNPTQPGDEITLTTPTYIALTEGSAFAAVTNTLVRSADLTVSWTSDTPASETDEVSVDVNGATTQVYCTFPASAGSGVVPAAALGNLQAGEASYNVHSKTYSSESMTAADGTPWGLGFNVDATARTSYGLANGSLTIE